MLQRIRKYIDVCSDFPVYLHNSPRPHVSFKLDKTPVTDKAGRPIIHTPIKPETVKSMFKDINIPEYAIWAIMKGIALHELAHLTTGEPKKFDNWLYSEISNIVNDVNDTAFLPVKWFNAGKFISFINTLHSTVHKNNVVDPSKYYEKVFATLNKKLYRHTVSSILYAVNYYRIHGYIRYENDIVNNVPKEHVLHTLLTDCFNIIRKVKQTKYNILDDTDFLQVREDAIEKLYTVISDFFKDKIDTAQQEKQEENDDNDDDSDDADTTDDNSSDDTDDSDDSDESDDTESGAGDKDSDIDTDSEAGNNSDEETGEEDTQNDDSSSNESEDENEDEELDGNIDEESDEEDADENGSTDDDSDIFYDDSDGDDTMDSPDADEDTDSDNTADEDGADEDIESGEEIDDTDNTSSEEEEESNSDADSDTDSDDSDQSTNDSSNGIPSDLDSISDLIDESENDSTANSSQGENSGWNLTDKDKEDIEKAIDEALDAMEEQGIDLQEDYTRDNSLTEPPDPIKVEGEETEDEGEYKDEFEQFVKEKIKEKAPNYMSGYTGVSHIIDATQTMSRSVDVDSYTKDSKIMTLRTYFKNILYMRNAVKRKAAIIGKRFAPENFYKVQTTDNPKKWNIRKNNNRISKTHEGSAIGLVFDKSSSMRGLKENTCRKIYHSFYKALDRLNRLSIGLFSFDTDYYILKHFNSRQLTSHTMHRVIESGLQASGGTNFPEAYYYGLKYLSKTNRPRKVLMLLTDGDVGTYGTEMLLHDAHEFAVRENIKTVLINLDSPIHENLKQYFDDVVYIDSDDYDQIIDVFMRKAQRFI